MDVMMWAAYSKTDTRNPFGRYFIGFTGWHADSSSALAEAIKRYPDWPASDIAVNRV